MAGQDNLSESLTMETAAQLASADVFLIIVRRN